MGQNSFESQVVIRKAKLGDFHLLFIAELYHLAAPSSMGDTTG